MTRKKIQILACAKIFPFARYREEKGGLVRADVTLARVSAVFITLGFLFLNERDGTRPTAHGEGYCIQKKILIGNEFCELKDNAREYTYVEILIIDP